MQFLQSVQGQASSFHNFIKLLNSTIKVQFLIFWGSKSHIFGPKYGIDWIL